MPKYIIFLWLRQILIFWQVVWSKKTSSSGNSWLFNISICFLSETTRKYFWYNWNYYDSSKKYNGGIHRCLTFFTFRAICSGNKTVYLSMSLRPKIRDANNLGYDCVGLDVVMILCECFFVLFLAKECPNGGLVIRASQGFTTPRPHWYHPIHDCGRGGRDFSCGEVRCVWGGRDFKITPLPTTTTKKAYMFEKSLILGQNRAKFGISARSSRKILIWGGRGRFPSRCGGDRPLSQRKPCRFWVFWSFLVCNLRTTVLVAAIIPKARKCPSTFKSST